MEYEKAKDDFGILDKVNLYLEGEKYIGGLINTR